MQTILEYSCKVIDLLAVKDVARDVPRGGRSKITSLQEADVSGPLIHLNQDR